MSIKRVLFVDNHKDFLQTRLEFLTAAGYRAFGAETLSEARLYLADMYLHLAILDIRLIDDKDDKDTSGLRLAKEREYQLVPKIMLTDYPDYRAARESLGAALDGLPPAVNYLAKVEGPSAMIVAVERAFTNYVRINWTLPIRFTRPSSFTHLTNLIDPTIPAEWLQDRAAELEDLFRKLFYANEQITIGRVLRKGPGQIEVEVYAYGGNENRGQFVVSCGQRDLIQEEKERYDKWSPGDTDIGSTDLVEHKETMRFGVIAYRLMGGDELEDMETLAVYYRRHGADEVKDALDHLYKGSLTAWHNTEQTYADDTSLQALYLDWLGLDGDDAKTSLAEKIESLCSHALRLARTDYSPEMLTFHLESDKATSFPNPLHLLSGDAIPISQPILIGATHGRVDAQSVLVDKSGKTWLIGFRHAEPGPLLRDFIYLEDALKTHFAEGMILPDFHALEQRLLDVSDLLSPIPTDDLSPHQTKLVESVMHIRHLAAERGGSEAAPYFAGLLACALAHVNTFDATVKYYSNRELMPYVRSLLQAAMLSAKLTLPLPVSAELPAQAYNSLWLDEKNKAVWVEGKEIELTPQDYKLLYYFYERPGQLCTRKLILAKALEDSSELIHVESKLTNAIRRLRQKIEPNPKKPKYLKTLKGQGYKFVL